MLYGLCQQAQATPRWCERSQVGCGLVCDYGSPTTRTSKMDPSCDCLIMILAKAQACSFNTSNDTHSLIPLSGFPCIHHTIELLLTALSTSSRHPYSCLVQNSGLCEREWSWKREGQHSPLEQRLTRQCMVGIEQSSPSKSFGETLIISLYFFFRCHFF